MYYHYIEVWNEMLLIIFNDLKNKNIEYKLTWWNLDKNQIIIVCCLVLFLRNITHWETFFSINGLTDSDTVDYQSVWHQKYISDLHYIKCLLFISILNLNCWLQSKIKGFRHSFISGPRHFPSLSMFIEGQSY